MGADAQKITTDVTGNDTAGMSVDEHSNTLRRWMRYLKEIG